MPQRGQNFKGTTKMVEIRFMNSKLVKSTQENKSNRVFRAHKNTIKKGENGAERKLGK